MATGPDPRPLSRRELLKRTGLVTAGTVAGAAAINATAPVLLPEPASVDLNRSYWSRALPAAGSPLLRSLDADVAIVGGGLTGLSTAYYLARGNPGRRVVVLEARSCGNGASARNGAMLLTSTCDRWLVPSRRPDLDRRLYALTVQNIADLRALAAELGTDMELDTAGAVQVFNTAAEARAGRETAARLEDAGIPVAWWDAEQTHASLGTRLYPGALFDPASGQLHPGKLVGLFKAAASAAGAQVYENTRVAAVDEGRVHTLRTDTGQRVRAAALVLATNAYSSQLGYLRGAYAPLLEYVAITPPLAAERIAALGWRTRTPFTDSRTEVFYLGLTRDNRIHIGGGPVGYRFNNGTPPAAVPPPQVAALRGELGRIFPELGAVPFESCWDGAVDMSLDSTPAVGRMGRYGNVYYGIGYSGHGVNLTSVFGRILADLIDGHGARWSWLPYLDRLPPYVPNEPFRWLGLRAALAAIRASEP